jgi:hypothetical protein
MAVIKDVRNNMRQPELRDRMSAYLPQRCRRGQKKVERPV